MNARPPAADGTLSLTRAHLFALAAMALALAVLAFFVGLQAGRNQTATSVAVIADPPLVGAEARSGNLETLLHGVEQAGRKASGEGGSLAFPTALEAVVPPPAVVLDAEGNPVPPPPVEDPFPDAAKAGAAEVPGAPAPAPAPLGAVPSSGWALEVGTRPDARDAQLLVDTLGAAGLPAYAMPAAVGGALQYRIRVGGYANKDAATAAATEVAARAGADAATAVAAP